MIINTAKGSLFNLNQTIYKRYYQKPYFQIVAVIPEGSEELYKEAIEELSAFTDISKWHFIYTNTTTLTTLFNSFKTPFSFK